MIAYNDEILHHNQPKKNFSIKKHRKLASIHGTIPVHPFPDSQPASPRKLIQNDLRTPRDTNRFFNDFAHKNNLLLQPRHLLPSLTHQNPNTKRSESPTPTTNKYLLPVKESKSTELYLNDYLNNEQLEEHPVLSKIIGAKVKQEAATIELQQPSRMKPLIIHNRLMSKFGMVKPGSHQIKYSKKKPLINDTLENPELFTFYPKQSSCESNEFLEGN